MNLEKARYNMIEQQIRVWDVLDTDLLDLLSSVHRENFVPHEYRKFAFTDMQIPLGHDQVMMHPKEEARMLQALKVKSTDRVLEIGTGSGFVTMLLATLGHSVVSIEILPDLRTAARQHLDTAKISNATLELGDGSAGWERGGPYDVICITGSMPQLPSTFKHQLKVGGRLFVILGQDPVMTAALITRVGAEEWSQENLYETYLPSLIIARRDHDDFEF